MKRFISSLILFCTMFVASFAWSQQTTGDPTGPYGSVTGSEIETVDLATLGVTVKVPIIVKQGPIPTDAYDLFHSGGCYYWILQSTGAPTLGCFTPGLTPLFPKATPFPTTHITNLLGAQPQITGVTTEVCPGDPTPTAIYNLGVLLTDGSLHPVPGTLHVCTLNTLSGVAEDNSGYYLTAHFAGAGNVQNIDFNIIGPDGSTTNGGTLNITNGVTADLQELDAYGNAEEQGDQTLGIPHNEFLDYLSYPTSTLSYTGTGTATVWNWLDTSGTSRSRTVTAGANGNFGLTPACGLSGQPGWSQPISFTYTYPDGATEQVNMEQQGSNYSARIGSVKLRTGATITYAYGAFVCEPTGAGELYPSTLTRTTPDGATTYNLALTSHVDQDNGVYSDITDTVMDPGGNESVYMFTGYGAPYSDPFNYAPVATQVQVYQNIGTPASPNNVIQKTVIYCYNNAQPNPLLCPTQTYSASHGYPITQKDVYTYLGPSSGTGSTYMSHETITYDTYGNTLSDATTDQITGQTITDTYQYGTWNGTNCVAIGNNINDHPCTITTTAGSSQLARTTFTYDTNTQTPFAIGLLTSKTESVNGGSLTTTYTPNTIRGTYASVQMPNNQTINYTYASNAGGCNNLLPTSVSSTIGSETLTTGTTWNCDMGVAVADKDYNGNPTASTYDTMGRLASFSDRTNYLTNFTYGVTSGNLVSFNSHSSMTSPSVVHDHTDYYDSLGRTTISQNQSKPNSNSYDTVSATYGWKSGSTALSNFQTTTSVHCAAAAGVGCSSVALTTLDNPGFGPVSLTNSIHGKGAYAHSANDTSFTLSPAPTGEHTKVLQNEVDGLGRLRSSCKLESVTGVSACGQAMGHSGILTTNLFTFGAGTTTTTVTRGTQVHTEVADSLGRITSVTTPESGMTSFSYDTIPSGCFQSGTNEKGFPTQTLFADGTQVCPEHDGLGRIVVMRGSNSSTNLCRRFVYDLSTNGVVTAPTGYSGSNLLGNVVEAETDNCTTPITPITDEWLSYDKEDRITDKWQSTPNSGGYYHTTVTYNADGSLATLGGIPGTTAFTFGVDGQGRPNAMSQGSLVIVSATAGSGFKYDHDGAVLNVPVGSAGDQDTYTYDTMENMKTALFTVNGLSKGLTLTWNPIGSLGKQAVTDTFFSGGAQTCSYGYDDVARIASDTCTGGPAWTQTFSYGPSGTDPGGQYGNLSKSGSSSWNPGYNLANNQILGGSYDAAGRVKNDTINTYTWDPFGMMATASGAAGSSTATYDAYGALVETNNGFSFSQILQSPIGKVAYMNGQTVNYTFVPTPGGGMYLGSGGSSYYFHPDWLGTKPLISDIGFRLAFYDVAYTPYGEPYNAFGTSGSNLLDFTGDNQDFLAGLWHTSNRELLINSSRWSSPDTDVFGWNAYGYVGDPNREADPLGLDGCDGADACVTDTFVSVDTVTTSVSLPPLFVPNVSSGLSSLLDMFTMRPRFKKHGKSPNKWPGGKWQEMSDADELAGQHKPLTPMEDIYDRINRTMFGVAMAGFGAFNPPPELAIQDGLNNIQAQPIKFIPLSGADALAPEDIESLGPATISKDAGKPFSGDWAKDPQYAGIKQMTARWDYKNMGVVRWTNHMPRGWMVGTKAEMLANGWQAVEVDDNGVVQFWYNPKPQFMFTFYRVPYVTDWGKEILKLLK